VFKPTLSLDANMTVDAALERLAMNGLWADGAHPAAAKFLAGVSRRTGKPVEWLATSLARPLDEMIAAVRWQDGTLVRWYVWPLDHFIGSCSSKPGHWHLSYLLRLYSIPGAQVVRADSGRLGQNSVLLEGHEAVAAEINPRHEIVAPFERAVFSEAELALRSGRDVVFGANTNAIPPRTPANIKTWPRIDSPEVARAGTPFKVFVGFSNQKQVGVAGAQISIALPEDGGFIDMTVELSAARGVSAIDGWTHPLRFRPSEIASAEVEFELVGSEPETSEPLLTMLEVRYVIDGTVTGAAARMLILVGADEQRTLESSENEGMSNEAPPLSFTPDAAAPDLTVEIGKPDRNAANGQYVCTLFSPHALDTERGPFHIDLGQDAKTFAKALVEDVRVLSGDPLLGTTLEANGRLIAGSLPSQVFDALREVARHCAPAPPAVLIVSAEPYVPWELAWMDAPLDPSQPGWLGCQALIGRWLRTDESGASSNGLPRPPAHPVATISVRNLAVMAAWYKLESGLRRLQKAEDEARALIGSHGALSLEATSEAVRDLLEKSLGRRFDLVDGVEAVHFAGHGEFDPTRPDASALFLSNGMPLRSIIFRAAKYGGALQPLLFLNACMLGIGGELLGDMAGFPGNALRGGFGGVLGALWEVDDQVAHDIALEFWQRALPPPPTQGEPIGAILQSLRAKFHGEGESVPVSTYLAYVYYGHPRLTLTRAA
jgi:hypothetical protein